MTEDVFYVLHRIVGILNHVVQQGGDDRLDTEADLVYHDLGHCDWMQEVRLARTAPYPLMGLFGKEECSFYEGPVLLLLAYLLARFHQIGPLALDELLILRSIVHTCLFLSFHRFAHLAFDLVAKFHVVLEQLLHRIAALPDLLLAV